MSWAGQHAQACRAGRRPSGRRGSCALDRYPPRKRAYHPFSGWFGIDAAGQRLASIPPLWTVLWYRSPVITPRRPYRTDLSDARGAVIEPLLSQWRAQRAGLGIAKIQHDLREIVNAILYVNRTGIAWGDLPHDFPPH